MSLCVVLCVYVHVCTCLCVRTCVCLPVWRLEEDFGHQGLSLAAFCSPEGGLSLKLELATFWPGEMAIKPQGSSSLCPSSSDITGGRTHMVRPDFRGFCVSDLRP